MADFTFPDAVVCKSLTMTLTNRRASKEGTIWLQVSRRSRSIEDDNMGAEETRARDRDALCTMEQCNCKYKVVKIVGGHS